MMQQVWEYGESLSGCVLMLSSTVWSKETMGKLYSAAPSLPSGLSKKHNPDM